MLNQFTSFWQNWSTFIIMKTLNNYAAPSLKVSLKHQKTNTVHHRNINRSILYTREPCRKLHLQKVSIQHQDQAHISSTSKHFHAQKGSVKKPKLSGMCPGRSKTFVKIAEIYSDLWLTTNHFSKRCLLPMHKHIICIIRCKHPQSKVLYGRMLLWLSSGKLESVLQYFHGKMHCSETILYPLK